MGSCNAYDFGRFHLDAESRVLAHNGVAIAIAPRTFDLLAVLVTSNGRLLSKNELLRIVWGDVNVEEASLAFQVSTLRRVLGEEGSSWIETVPKHGYRFRAPVVECKLDAAGPGPSATATRRRTQWAVGLLLLAVCALGISWHALKRNGTESHGPEANIVPVTSYPGVENHPSLSPDGSQVAFSWEGEPAKDPDIYVQVIGHGKPVPLTTNPRPEFSPAWSPNGEWIAFCRDTDAGGEIVLVRASGGSERIVARSSASWTPRCSNSRPVLSWFPSSDALAAVGSTAPDVPLAIYVVPIDGSVVRQITTPTPLTTGDELPSVSPDGRFLAFTRGLSREWGEAEVCVLPVGADKSAVGAPEILVPERNAHGRSWTAEEPVFGIGWLPHRNEVLLSRLGLWAVPLAGRRAPTEIRTAGERLGPFSVSRDGSRLVFSTAALDSSADWDIWQLPGPEDRNRDSQIALPGRVLIHSTRLDSNAQYSPQGNRIVFTSERSGTQQLWVADADGSNQMQLTHSRFYPGSPRWSPDGRYIAYDGLESPKGDIFVMPAEGGAELRVTTDASHEQVPTWSRDGRWIYYESDRTGSQQLWKTEFPSGSTVQVTFEGGAGASESPDARWLYYAKRGRTGIWRRPLAGGGEERVTDRGYPMLWGLYDKGGCLMNPQTPEVTVECFSFESNRLSIVARFPNGGAVRPAGGPGFAISPDGKWILYTRVGPEEADLMMIDHLDALGTR
jgi:Tol biopolymer transport system component/DNA-binding winged helix-turn-helix (wHTH) protein